jgi:hypothetical protein
MGHVNGEIFTNFANLGSIIRPSVRILFWHWYRLSKSAKACSVRLRGNEKIIKDWTQFYSYYTIIIVTISKIRKKENNVNIEQKLNGTPE